jgi:hypothetical protein
MKTYLKNRYFYDYRRLNLVVVGLLFVLSFSGITYASPYGQGVYSAQVPYGSQTSLSINIGSNVSFNLVPSGLNYAASGSQTITVISTNVVGYQLYIYDPTSTSMVNGSSTIPASSNITEAALSVNSWGYNSDGSSNYIGLTTIPKPLASYSGPYETGNNTTVNYGVLVSATQPAGSYTASVYITAIGLNE